MDVYRNKPESYLSNLIGHEGEGSLHHFLNEKGWIESLGSGSQDFDRNTSLMIVNIELTEAGRAHVAEITDLLFQYFEMLRDQPPKIGCIKSKLKSQNLAFAFKSKARRLALFIKWRRGWTSFLQKICWSPHTLWRFLTQHLSNSSWVT
ncbi:MAG: hypothetical protein CM15mP120_11900 [Pseudomonadota bacterium]|nr:MAG: hypothetical protein CM15mP120_11900 [Pseudomonadota bacterium]